MRPAFSPMIDRSPLDAGHKRMARAPAPLLRTIRCIAILAMCALALSKVGFADTIPAPRVGPIVDLADILPPAAEQTLAQQLRTLRLRSGVDLVVVTLPGLQTWSIERWGRELRTAWAVGGRSSLGALLIVDADQPQAYIDVGSGLSPMLPEAVATDIVKIRIAPLFQSGDLAGGTLAGIDAIIKKVMAPVSAANTLEPAIAQPAVEPSVAQPSKAPAAAQPANEPATAQPAGAQRRERTRDIALASCLAILLLAVWVTAKLKNLLGGNRMQPYSPIAGRKVASAQGVERGAGGRAAPWLFGRRVRHVGGGNASSFTHSRQVAGGSIAQAARSGSGDHGMSRAAGRAAADEGDDRPREGASGR